MEPDILEVLLCECQCVARIGQIDIASVFIDSHVGVFAPLEVSQLGGIVALDPACLVDRNRLPAAGCTVFMGQTVLDHLELQGTDRADDFAAVERRGEELGDTLVHQLVDTLCQLLELERVGILDVTELFGCEGGNACEFKFFAFGKGVADLEVARIVQADNVARIGEVDHRFLLGHEGGRRGELELLAAADVQVVLVAFEHTGTDLQEGDSVAVVRVHVGVDLEDESGHLLLLGFDQTGLGRSRSGRRGDAEETFEQLTHAEVVDRRSEEDRGQIALQIGLAVERVVYPLDQFDILPQAGGVTLSDVTVQLR